MSHNKTKWKKNGREKKECEIKTDKFVRLKTGVYTAYSNR